MGALKLLLCLLIVLACSQDTLGHRRKKFRFKFQRPNNGPPIPDNLQSTLDSLEKRITSLVQLIGSLEKSVDTLTERVDKVEKDVGVNADEIEHTNATVEELLAKTEQKSEESEESEAEEEIEEGPTIEELVERIDELEKKVNECESDIEKTNASVDALRSETEETIEDLKNTTAIDDLTERVDGIENRVEENENNIEKTNETIDALRVDTEQKLEELEKATTNATSDDLANLSETLTTQVDHLAQALQLPDGVFHKGHKYFYSPEELIQANAQAYCKEYGAYLAEPNDEDEFKFLIDAALPSMPDANRNVWLGIADHKGSGTMQAESQPGANVYVKWAANQPNNHNNLQPCVQLWRDEAYDVECDTKNPVLCEAVVVNHR